MHLTSLGTWGIDEWDTQYLRYRYKLLWNRAHISFRSQRKQGHMANVGVYWHTKVQLCFQTIGACDTSQVFLPQAPLPKLPSPSVESLLPVSLSYITCHCSHWLKVTLFILLALCWLVGFACPLHFSSSSCCHQHWLRCLQILLAVLSLISIIKSFSTMCWSSHILISFYRMQILN